MKYRVSVEPRAVRDLWEAARWILRANRVRSPVVCRISIESLGIMN